MFMMILLFLMCLTGAIALSAWNKPSTAKHAIAMFMSLIVGLLAMGRVLNGQGGEQLLAILITVGALFLGVALLLQQSNR